MQLGQGTCSQFQAGREAGHKTHDRAAGAPGLGLDALRPSLADAFFRGLKKGLHEDLWDHGADVTPLHEAALNGESEKVAKLLAKYGAEVDAPRCWRERCKATPLIEAADQGHVAVAKWLLTHSAAVNA